MLSPAGRQVTVKEERHLCLLPPCLRAQLLVPLWLVSSTHLCRPLNGPWSLVLPLPLYLCPLLSPRSPQICPLFVVMAPSHPPLAHLYHRLLPLFLQLQTYHQLPLVCGFMPLVPSLFHPLFLSLCLLPHSLLHPLLYLLQLPL